MDTFLMVCYVCADFVSKTGEIFQITPENLGLFIKAPVWIKKTIMYDWLVNDGSIKTALDAKEQKKLENDPMEGITAEGKDEAKAPAEDESPVDEQPKPVKKTSTKAKKGEAK